LLFLPQPADSFGLQPAEGERRGRCFEEDQRLVAALRRDAGDEARIDEEANAPANFSGDFRYTLFRYRINISSPDFGAGSYMGFRTDQGNYGWLEVTWTSTSLQFQILSGAYENVAGVAILAGDTGAGPAPIPEPGTWVAMAVFAGGAAFARWRKRRDEAQQEAA
jgi:hypothetical protein